MPGNDDGYKKKMTCWRGTETLFEADSQKDLYDWLSKN